jgi:hypothetical protein
MLSIPKLISYIIVYISVVSLNSRTHLFNMYTLWASSFLVILLLYKVKYSFVYAEARNNLFWLNLFVLYMILSIIRGFILAENYWDFKGLITNAFGLLLFMGAYLSLNKQLLQQTIHNYVYIALPLCILFIPVLLKTTIGAIGYYSYGLCILLLFSANMTRPWRWLFVALALGVIFIDFSARAIILKLVISALLGFSFYFKNFISNKVLRFIWFLLLIGPILLFGIAVYTPFNVLNVEGNTDVELVIQKKNQKGKEFDESLLADNRTPLYKEVLSTAKKYNTWWFGRSPARGNETKIYTSSEKFTGRKERIANEIGVLNIFMWTGVVGVLLYFLMFLKASYMALYKSNNYFAKILGIYLAFRWGVFWVEDITTFMLDTYVLVLLLGLASSTWFRSMNNQEVKLWVRGFFNKKLSVAYLNGQTKANSSINNLPQSEK